MATRKNKNFLFLGGKDRITPLPSSTSTLQFEFDEAEMWSNSEEINVVHNSEQKISIPSSRISKKTTKKGDRRAISSTSLPVNIPDWSKILGNDQKGSFGNNDVVGYDYDDDVDFDYESRIPPHEYLARTRVASFSVHEGIGRTLKGRDLSRVRNAIWKQTGFED
ncbi:protein S40-4-like [Lycium ferocissimum]|uniref:protein S40-4-like n=1 Tax=Lycium ferocissimum TaxID=112874 RepID=UPI002815102C|nr:protein S40-4-like [Lycium ferocissimum]